MSSFVPLLTTGVITAVQCVVVALVYAALRNKPRFAFVFSPRPVAKPHRTPQALQREANQPPAIPFVWVPQVLRVPDDELCQLVGLDTFMFLRFLFLALRVSAVGTVLSCAVLLPLYGTGGNDEDETDGFNGLTLANVKPGSWRLWFALLFMWVFVGFACWQLWRECAMFVRRRMEFLAKGDMDADKDFRRTVLVEDIPIEHRSSQALRNYFDFLFPDQVDSAHVCVKTQSLDKLLAKRTTHIDQHAQASLYNRNHPAKPAKTVKVETKGKACLKVGGRKVDAVQFHADEFDKVSEEANKEEARVQQYLADINDADLSKFQPTSGLVSLAKLGNNDGEQGQPSDLEKTFRELNTPSGFVKFKTLGAKQAAVQAELAGTESSVRCVNAPAPVDVLWNNLAKDTASEASLKRVVNGLWVLGILFWAVIVSGITLVSNLESYRDYVWVPESGSVLYGLLSGYLPVVLLILLMILLPIFIELSAKKLIGMKSASQVDAYTFKWHAGFQIANLWVLLASGSLFNQIEDIIDKPEDTVKLIAVAVPAASQTLILLTITKLFGLFMEHGRLVPVVLSVVLGWVKADKDKTAKELSEARKPPFLKWGWVYPPHILTLFVGFVLAGIVPLAQIFVTLYFAVAYLVFRHQALHVYAQPSEGGGQVFMMLVNILFNCLHMSLLIFAAYLGTKEGAVQAPLAFITLGLTIAFHMRLRARFLSHSNLLALQVARRMDIEEEKGEGEGQGEEQGGEGKVSGYVHPSLAKSKWDDITDPKAMQEKVVVPDSEPTP